MFWFQRSRILLFVQNVLEARGWSERTLQVPAKLAEPERRKFWFQEEGGEFCSICAEFKFEVCLLLLEEMSMLHSECGARPYKKGHIRHRGMNLRVLHIEATNL